MRFGRRRDVELWDRVQRLRGDNVTYDAIAEVVGKSRGSICSIVRVLQQEGALPPPRVKHDQRRPGPRHSFVSR